MESYGSLLWSVLYGSIGAGYLIYGRKNRRALALLSGILLIVVPYFISGTLPLIALGLLLMALPYFVRY